MSRGGKGRPWLLLLQNRRPCSTPWKASWWQGTWGEAGLQPRTSTRAEPCPAVLWPFHLCLALRIRQGREALRLCPPTLALGARAHGRGAPKVPLLASTVDLPAIRRPAPGCRCPLGPVWAKWREEAVGVGPLAHWVVGWADCKGRFAPPRIICPALPDGPPDPWGGLFLWAHHHSLASECGGSQRHLRREVGSQPGGLRPRVASSCLWRAPAHLQRGASGLWVFLRAWHGLAPLW